MLIGQSRRAGKRAYLAVPVAALCALTALASCSYSGSSDSSGSAAVTSALTIPGPTGPLEAHTITVEAVPTADEAGLYIAKDLGYFAQEGLTVNIEPTGGGELAIPDLKDGKAQLVAGNYVSFIQAQIAGQVNLRIIANGSQMQPGNQGLYVLPDSPIKSVANLATARPKPRVGVNTAKNIGTLLIGSLLQDHGYQLNDVSLFVPTPAGKNFNPFGALITDLQKHAIDAAWLPEPFGTIAEQQLGAVKIADFDSASLTNFPIGTYIGTQTWVQTHPNTVAAFLHALQEGQQKADVDRSQVEASLVSNTLVPNAIPEAVAKQIAALMTLDTYPLTMDVPTMQRVSNAMFEFGLEPGLKKPYNISNMTQTEPGMIG
ncbi:MAG TPA: ABC transporter substrate-binding protein [Trebonia sp.]|nr:ABC transporter substrate-binding protein [Trebonia sp.]